VHLKLKACEADTCNVIHSFWVPELAGTRDVVPGRTNELTLTADHPGTFLGQCKEYCGLSHANMRFRVVAKTRGDFEQWVSEQQQGPAQPLLEGEGADAKPAGPAQELIVTKYQCTNCHTFDDSSLVSYGPNLTHLASRDYFASATYELNKKNLVSWVMNAPSMIPMQTEDPKCRPSAVEDVHDAREGRLDADDGIVSAFDGLVEHRRPDGSGDFGEVRLVRCHHF
jgi:cytochrome c oxidase subunit 2